MLFKENALAVMFKRLDEMLPQFVVTFKLRKLFIPIRQHELLNLPTELLEPPLPDSRYDLGNPKLFNLW